MRVVRTRLWLLLYEAAESSTTLCSGRKGSCCWGQESHPCCLAVSSLAPELVERRFAPLQAAFTPLHTAESSHVLGRGSRVGSGSLVSSGMGANILLYCQHVFCWK